MDGADHPCAAPTVKAFRP